mgnify:FL=1
MGLFLLRTPALPPLPKKAIVDRHLPTGIYTYGYTADPIRAYGEQCAREARLAERAAAADECFRQIARWADDRARFAAGECAAAIRARKDSE